jgi:hypothetical protein
MVHAMLMEEAHLSVCGSFFSLGDTGYGPAYKPFLHY